MSCLATGKKSHCSAVWKRRYAPTVGADSIRPKPDGIEPSVEWWRLLVTTLGFPRGEAARLDGTSEPARLADEGWRQIGK